MGTRDSQIGSDKVDEAILIAYGSNQPPHPETSDVSPWQALALVVNSLRDNGVKPVRISRLWRSVAWPDPTDPPYYNAVLQISTPLEAESLLNLLHRLEADRGRVRDITQTGKRYAPRVLDLDLIAYGRETLSYSREGRVTVGEGGLVLPHPRAHERGFVMGPLAEILPDWRHPVFGRTASELWAEVTVGADAHPLEEPV